MRKSYTSYFFKKIREGDVFIVPRTAYQYFALRYSRIRHKPFTGPLHGSIIATYRCNLRCSMCELYKRPKEYEKLGKKELATEEMKAIINDFAAIRTAGIGFTGGEPLLRGDMPELITYAKNKGMITHMSSNGFAINENVAKKIMESGLDAIGFSLDGSTKETHDGIRGVKGSYDRVINAISIFNKLNKTAKKKIIIVVVTVISTINLHEIKDIVYTLKKMGVDKISFIPFHDIGILSDGTPKMKKLKIEKSELMRLDNVIDELIRIRKKESIIDSSEGYLRMFKYCFRGKPSHIPCYAGYATLAIDGYGDIYPCFPFAEIGLKGHVTNVRDVNLKDYWRSKKMQNVRDSVRDCRKCYWNNQAEINLLFYPNKVKDIKSTG
jgi:radical SAM protein with 4Fe4S-binding SPASM domain